MKPDLDRAIVRAEEFLCAQAEGSFAEVHHDMIFPRWAGFRAKKEEQSSDIFARAVLGGLLVNLMELNEGDRKADWLRLARREADYVAASKLKDRDGGWSYFPDLPELPPDLDSLSAAIFLFSRVAREHLPHCEDPIRLALDAVETDGSTRTWIVASTNARAHQRSMKRGIKRFWGNSVDVEVCARFFLALHTMKADRFADVVRKGVEFVISRQQPTGAWNASWYWGDVYGSGLCLRLLRELELGRESISQAIEYLLGLQRDDGGWGVWESVPLDTACAIWAIAADHDSARKNCVWAGVDVLLKNQSEDGSWPATPWIKMEVGRVFGLVLRTLTYQSTTLTTAFSLRSLLMARQLAGNRNSVVPFNLALK